MVLRRRASRSGRCQTGGPWEEIGGQRRHRSDSTFSFKQTKTVARAAAAARATVRQERIRQLVVFTPPRSCRRVCYDPPP